MKQLRALVIDDESNARDGLISLLELYCPEVTIAGAAASIPDALQKLAALSPDVVFLDIEMPEGTGFELVETIRREKSAIIFVTAHIDYAIRAFRAEAVDYLLKPVAPAELKEAVARVLARMDKPDASAEYRIRISDNEGIRFVSCSEVIGVEGDGRYSVLHLSGGQTQMVSRNIGDFETELEPYGFFRVHKSWLVNCAHVIQLAREDGGTIELSNGKKVLLSRRKRNEFLKRMEL